MNQCKKKKVGGGEGGSYDITSQYRENVIDVSNISRRRLICDLLFLYATYEVKHGEVVFTTICIRVFAGLYIQTMYNA